MIRTLEIQEVWKKLNKTLERDIIFPKGLNEHVECIHPTAIVDHPTFSRIPAEVTEAVTTIKGISSYSLKSDFHANSELQWICIIYVK